MNWFYEYKVKVWNETNKKEEILHGIIYAENFAEVGEKIDKYYGDELIEISISPTAEKNCYEFEENLDEDSSEIFKDITIHKNLQK